MRTPILTLYDKPLIQVATTGALKALEHLLKECDRPHVSEIIYMLNWHDLTPHFGGEVVSGWLFRGKSDYTTVDITTVPQDYDERNEMVKERIRTAFNRSDKYFGYGGSGFKVNYFQGDNFQIVPIKDMLNHEPIGSPINVYLTKKGELK